VVKVKKSAGTTPVRAAAAKSIKNAAVNKNLKALE
jgi:hypothetical protein